MDCSSPDALSGLGSSFFRRRRMKKTLFIFILFLITGDLVAASLKVSPGGFIVHDIKPGTTYNLRELTGIKLSIYNDDETTHTYSLSVHKPSVAGKWEKGYDEIPDPAWCWFSPDEATIGPQKVGYGNLFFRIPDKERYYNQRWVATLGIMGKQEQGIGFGLGIYVRVQIETESAADVSEKPDGALGLVPGALSFENIPPGKSLSKKVRIYNNDTMAHTYTIAPLTRDPEMTPSTYLTRSLQQLPDSSWISCDKESLTIKPDKSGVLTISLHVPRNPEYSDKKWEELLFLKPENGRSGFIRIRITTTKTNDEQK